MKYGRNDELNVDLEPDEDGEYRFTTIGGANAYLTGFELARLRNDIDHVLGGDAAPVSKHEERLLRVIIYAQCALMLAERTIALDEELLISPVVKKALEEIEGVLRG